MAFTTGFSKLGQAFLVASSVLAAVPAAAETNILYQEDTSHPGAGGVAYVDATTAIEAGSALDDGTPGKTTPTKHCFIVNGDQIAALKKGDAKTMLGALANSWDKHVYHNSIILTDANPIHIDSVEAYNAAHGAEISAALREGYNIYNEFIRIVPDYAYTRALTEKLDAGILAQSLWAGNETNPDVQTFLGHVLDERMNDLARLENAIRREGQGNPVPFAMLWYVHDKLRELVPNSGWDANPFFTLGLAAQHEDLVRRAGAFRAKYETLTETDFRIYTMRNLMKAYTDSAGRMEKNTAYACTTMVDIRGGVRGRWVLRPGD